MKSSLCRKSEIGVLQQSAVSNTPLCEKAGENASLYCGYNSNEYPHPVSFLVSLVSSKPCNL